MRTLVFIEWVLGTSRKTPDRKLLWLETCRDFDSPRTAGGSPPSGPIITGAGVWQDDGLVRAKKRQERIAVLICAESLHCVDSGSPGGRHQGRKERGSQDYGGRTDQGNRPGKFEFRDIIAGQA